MANSVIDLSLAKVFDLAKVVLLKFFADEENAEAIAKNATEVTPNVFQCENR